MPSLTTLNSASLRASDRQHAPERLLKAPRGFRCNIVGEEETGGCIIRIGPLPVEYGFVVGLLAVIWVLMITFYSTAARGPWDLWNWGLVWFCTALAVVFSVGLLCQLTVRTFQARPGEFDVMKSILGMTRRFRMVSGTFEVLRFHGAPDMSDQPYEMRLEAMNDGGDRVMLIHVRGEDYGFVRNLSAVLAETTGWKSVETGIYSPPSMGDSSGP